MNRRRNAASFSGVILLMSLVTACGEDSNASGNDDDGASAGDTVKIAMGNMTTGNVSFPAIEEAAQVAVEALNADGGIAGQQVELAVCDMKNEDSAAQACGQELANDEDIAFGVVTMTNNGAPYWNSAKGSGKPVVLGLGLTPADDTAENTYSYLSSTSGTFRGYANYVLDQGYESVAYIHHDDASMVAAQQVFIDALGDADVDVNTTVLPTSAADNVAQLSSAGVDEADVVIVQSAGKCPQIAQDFASIGLKPEKVLTGSACLPTTALTENPELFENWTLLGPLKLTAAGKGSDPDVDAFLKAWEKYSGTTEPPGVYAQLGWSVIMNAAAALEQAGVTEVTPQSASEAFAAFTGPSVMGPTTIECPGPEDAPVGCGSDLVAYSINDGKLTLEE